MGFFSNKNKKITLIANIPYSGNDFYEACIDDNSFGELGDAEIGNLVELKNIMFEHGQIALARLCRLSPSDENKGMIRISTDVRETLCCQNGYEIEVKVVNNWRVKGQWSRFWNKEISYKELIREYKAEG
tara:strand:- start:199 stop:588 length:390 start_codon:yes stop_codon:yes gene_type:complete